LDGLEGVGVLAREELIDGSVTFVIARVNRRGVRTYLLAIKGPTKDAIPFQDWQN
jgi:hypothetical protein